MPSLLSRPDCALQSYFEDPCLKHAGDALRTLAQHNFSSVVKYKNWFVQGYWVGTPMESYWYWALLHCMDSYLLTNVAQCHPLFLRVWHISQYSKYKYAHTFNPDDITFFQCDSYWLLDWRYIGARLDTLSYSMTHWSEVVGLWDPVLGAVSLPIDTLWQNALASLYHEIGGVDYKVDQYSEFTEIASSIFKIESEKTSWA